MENVKLLFQLYYRPASAMSEILDKGSWFAAALIVLIVSAAFFFTVNAKLEAAYRIPASTTIFISRISTRRMKIRPPPKLNMKRL